jgi:hypothetical protein
MKLLYEPKSHCDRHCIELVDGIGTKGRYLSRKDDLMKRHLLH